MRALAALVILLAGCGDPWPPPGSQDDLLRLIEVKEAKIPANYFECGGIGGIGFPELLGELARCFPAPRGS